MSTEPTPTISVSQTVGEDPVVYPASKEDRYTTVQGDGFYLCREDMRTKVFTNLTRVMPGDELTCHLPGGGKHTIAHEVHRVAPDHKRGNRDMSEDYITKTFSNLDGTNATSRFPAAGPQGRFKLDCVRDLKVAGSNGTATVASLSPGTKLEITQSDGTSRVVPSEDFLKLQLECDGRYIYQRMKNGDLVR